MLKRIVGMLAARNGSPPGFRISNCFDSGTTICLGLWWHPDEHNNEIYYDLSNVTRHDVINEATLIGKTFLLMNLLQLHHLTHSADSAVSETIRWTLHF